VRPPTCTALGQAGWGKKPPPSLSSPGKIGAFRPFYMVSRGWSSVYAPDPHQLNALGRERRPIPILGAIEQGPWRER
jgi:hypothetical protein